MRARLRPYATAGVALVGASVIAIAPAVAPPPLPDITVAGTAVSSTQVDLTAVSNPLVALTQLFGNTTGNVSGLAEAFLDAPAPILQQVFINQLANVELVGETVAMVVELVPDLLAEIQTGLGEAVQQLVAGDFIGVGETLSGLLLPLGLPLLGVVAPPLLILQNTTANLANVPPVLINSLFTVLLPVIRLANSVIGATFDTAQGISDAFGEGDLLTAAGIVFSSPIVLTDALLNGFDENSGLLTPLQNPFDWGGPISALLQLRNAIADVLTPISTEDSQQSAASQAPDPDAEVVALSLDAAENEEGVTATTASARSANTSQTEDETTETAEVAGETVETTKVEAEIDSVPAIEVTKAADAGEVAAEEPRLVRESPKFAPRAGIDVRDVANDVRAGARDAANGVRNGIRGALGGSNKSQNSTSSNSSTSASSSSSASGGSSSGGSDSGGSAD